MFLWSVNFRDLIKKKWFHIINMLINYLLGRMHITATCAMIETLTIKALNVRRKQKGKINNY